MTDQRLRDLLEERVADLPVTDLVDGAWDRARAVRRRRAAVAGAAVAVLAVVGGTTAVVAVISRVFGLPWPQSIVLGGVVAMSSTVLIVQQLAERAEINRTHGRLAFSVVLFQDIAVVPFLALAAALALTVYVPGLAYV